MNLTKIVKHTILRSIRLAALTGAVAMYSASAFAAVATHELPTGGKFMGNNGGVIMSSNGVMNVIQNGTNAAIKWDTFNVGANATVNFTKGDRGVLNVLNYTNNMGKASEIYGRINAGPNDNVWLVNPNGVLIGKSAQIDVGHMHVASHFLTDNNLAAAANGTGNSAIAGIMTDANRTSAQLMNMGSMYVNSLSFDGDRVVVDADKLYNYNGEKQTVNNANGDYLKIQNTSGDVVVGKTTYDKNENITLNGANVGYSWVEDSEQLQNMNQNLAGNYALKAGVSAVNTKDMDNGMGFKPIGDAINAFTGKFDGLGYDIYGLTINRPGEDNVGLFGVTDGASLKNIRLSSGDIIGNNNVGSVVGKAQSTYIDGVYNSARVLGLQNVGGVAGITTGTTLNDVQNYAYIRGNVNVGGIVGNASNTNITGETYNTGAVSGIVNYKVALDIEDKDSIEQANATKETAGQQIATERTFAVDDGYLKGSEVKYKYNDESKVAYIKSGTTMADFTFVDVDGNDVTAEVVPNIKTHIVDGQEVAYKANDTITYDGGRTATFKEIDGMLAPAVTGSQYCGFKNSVKVSNTTYLITPGTYDVTETILNDRIEARGSHDVGGVAGTAGALNLGNDLYVKYDDSTSNEIIYKDDKVFAKGTDGYFREALKDSTGNYSVVNGLFVAGDNSERIQGFSIYNDTNIKAGYNVGGIIGSLTAEQNATDTIKNVTNNGDIQALGFRNEAYYYMSQWYYNCEIDMGYGTHSVQKIKDNPFTAVNREEEGTYINLNENLLVNENQQVQGFSTKDRLVDYEWREILENKDSENYYGGLYHYSNNFSNTNLRNKALNSGEGHTRNDVVMRKTVTAANAGGIVGLATGTVKGDSSPAITISSALNTGDISSKTMQAQGKSTDLNNDTVYTYEYQLAGNMGGIVGSAQGGDIRMGFGVTDDPQYSSTGIVISDSINKENFIQGSNNVGGIVGTMTGTKVTNVLNEGGDILGTGARNKNNLSVANSLDGGFSHEAQHMTTGEAFTYTDFVTGNIGGIVGKMFGDGAYVDEARNTGHVHSLEVDYNPDGTAIILDNNQAANIGGIVGKVDRFKTLEWNNPNLSSDINNWTNPEFRKGFDGTAAIQNSANTGIVTAYNNVGGVAGAMFYGEIQNSYNMGNVRLAVKMAKVNVKGNLGGIVGDTIGRPATDENGDYFNDYKPADGATIKTSATGTKLYDVYNSGMIGDDNFRSYAKHVGGIAGRFMGEMNKAYNAGDIYSGATTDGGIVGAHQLGEITNVFNAGNITVAGLANDNENLRVAGIVANASSDTKVYGAYNIGTIRVYSRSNNYTTIGGIIGNNRLENISGPSYFSTNSNIIKYCYSLGELYAGRIDTDGKITDTTYQSTRSDSTSAFANTTSGWTNVYKTIDNVAFIEAEDPERFYNFAKERASGSQQGMVRSSSDRTYYIKNATVDGQEYKVYYTIELNNTNAKVEKPAYAYFDNVTIGGTTYYGLYKITVTSGKETYTIATDDMVKGVRMSYADRYNIKNYEKLGITDYTSTTGVSNDNSGWVMYNYDAADGQTVTWKDGSNGTVIIKKGVEYNLIDGTKSQFKNADGQTITVVSTLPMLKAFMPDNANYLSSNADELGIKYIQYGNEREPDMTFVTMKETQGGSTPTLSLDHSEANLDNRTSIIVENGNLDIHNIQTDAYLSGTLMAKNGNVNLTAAKGADGDAINMKLATDSNIYGQNVNIINPYGDIRLDGNVISCNASSSAGGDNTVTYTNNNGGILMVGQNIDVYGSLKVLDKTNNDNNENYTFVGVGRNVGENSQEFPAPALADDPRGQHNLPLKDENIMPITYEGYNHITSKSHLYTEEVAVGENKGDIILRTDASNDGVAYGDVNVYYGNNKNGLLATEGDVSINAINAKIDSDMQIGTVGKDSTVTVTAKDVVIDYSNAKGFQDSFASGNVMKLQNSEGAVTEAIVVRDLFKKDNTIDSEKLADLSKDLNVYNGDAKADIYAWIENAEQLGNITSDALGVNFAMKHSIDASETPFETISGSYNGKFDGRGNDLNSITSTSNGIFESIGGTGVVKNLNINSSRITGAKDVDNIGIIAGVNEGEILNVSTFGNTVKQNAEHEGTANIGAIVGRNEGLINGNTKTEDVVYAEGINDTANVGGVAGANTGTIWGVEGRSATSTANGNTQSMGGVVGNNSGLVHDVSSSGVIAGLYDIPDDDSSEYDTYKYANAVGGVAGVNTGAGYIYEAYNEANVSGWKNVGGIIGSNEEGAYAFMASNAGDVLGAQNVGGVIGDNEGSFKAKEDAQKVDFSVDKVAFSDQSGADGLPGLSAESAAYLKEEFVRDTDLDIEKGLVRQQAIMGRNSAKIEAKANLYHIENDTEGNITSMEISDGLNAGGLIGVSGKKADAEYLATAKSAAIYGRQNVGGIIGSNEGVLRHSLSMLKTEVISGAVHVGGVVGINDGVIVGVQNYNRHEITTNDDYVYSAKDQEVDGTKKVGDLKTSYAVAEDGKTRLTIENAILLRKADGTVEKDETDKPLEMDKASFFGGILGYNDTKGVVGDVENYANVTINNPAHYVGGIIGRNNGTIAAAGQTIYDPATDRTTTLDDIVPFGYLRNKGAVGSVGGNYVGGVIGQNNAAIVMTDITNDISGTVTGSDYVGGIIGQNNALVSGGRDGQKLVVEKNGKVDAIATAKTYNDGNYLKYDVYNNGAVNGTNYVGGLIGANTVVTDTTKGNLTLAYNTGVVNGTNNVGGVVGANYGTVDQVFNSMAPYKEDGTKYTDTELGIHGEKNVGGLVGANGGIVSNAYNTGVVNGNSNVGSLIGTNHIITSGIQANGKLSTSYATDANMQLVGDQNNLGTLEDNYSSCLKDKQFKRQTN